MARFAYIINQGGGTLEIENLSSQVDGEKTIFTLSTTYKAGSLRVYFQGARQTGQFTELNSTQFQLNFVPPIGTKLSVDYAKP